LLFAFEGADDYDDDSDALGVDELRQLGIQPDAGDEATAVKRDMLESNVDSTDWKLEVEEILPQLKLAVHTESKVPNLRLLANLHNFALRFMIIAGSRCSDIVVA